MQQRPELEILQLRVGKVESQLAKIGGKAGLVHSSLSRQSSNTSSMVSSSWRTNPASRSTIWLRRAGESRPTMPKSIIAMRLPGRHITIAGMRIGLKEAVDQDHLEHGIRRARGESLAIEARVVDGRQIVAADALDVLLHIHRAARPFPVDAWHEHVEITGKIAGEAFGVACLYCEIELSLQRAAQLAYNVDGPVAPGLGCLLLGEMGKMLEDAQIGVDLSPRCRGGESSG